MKLIDDANRWYKLHSVQLAALAAPVVAYVLAHPYEVKREISSIGMALGLSDQVVSVLGGLAVSVIAIFARLRAQPSPPCPPAVDETDSAGA